jgi:hypothetical protein
MSLDTPTATRLRLQGAPRVSSSTRSDSRCVQYLIDGSARAVLDGLGERRCQIRESDVVYLQVLSDHCDASAAPACCEDEHPFAGRKAHEGRGRGTERSLEITDLGHDRFSFESKPGTREIEKTPKPLVNGEVARRRRHVGLSRREPVGARERDDGLRDTLLGPGQ